MSDRSGFGSFFVGLLAGTIVGAVATVLYAPKSGNETRASLKDKSEEFVDKANVSVDDAYKQAENAAREARDRFEELAATTRQRAEDITRRGQVILEEQIGNFKKAAEKPEEQEAEEILMQDDASEVVAEVVEEAKETAEDIAEKIEETAEDAVEDVKEEF